MTSTPGVSLGAADSNVAVAGSRECARLCCVLRCHRGRNEFHDNESTPVILESSFCIYICVQQDIDIWMRFQLLQRRHSGRIGCQSTINQHCQAGLLYPAIPQHGAGMNKWVVLPPISPIKQTRGYESEVDTIH